MFLSGKKASLETNTGLRDLRHSRGRTVGHFIARYCRALVEPWAATLNSFRHANMKELRFNAADGVWRVAFAFDRRRRAVLLVAGDKSGGSEKQFYRELIRKADNRFDRHLGATRKRKD